jgi:hypothetical protein
MIKVTVCLKALPIPVIDFLSDNRERARIHFFVGGAGFEPVPPAK